MNRYNLTGWVNLKDKWLDSTLHSPVKVSIWFENGEPTSKIQEGWVENNVATGWHTNKKVDTKTIILK